MIDTQGGGPNGNALGPDGYVYTAQGDGAGAVLRVNLKRKTYRTLYRDNHGEPFGSPNDMVFDEWGDFWFTDFKSGALFHGRTDGSAVRQVAGDLERANGIALSPDRRTLYVALTTAHRLVAFQIAGRGTLAGALGIPVAAEMPVIDIKGAFDGIAVEQSGNLVVASWGAGLTVLSPRGVLIEQVSLPNLRPRNLAFGGRDRRTLYITAIFADSNDGQLVSIRWPRPGLKLLYR